MFDDGGAGEIEFDDGGETAENKIKWEWGEFERKQKSGDDMTESPMGAAEYSEFIKEFQQYNKTVADAIKEFADKEVELEFDVLTEESFGKLMASNEWDMSQVMAISEIVL